MSAKPWYPWYVGDWRAKTNGLSLEQKGAYRELLDELYAKGGILPCEPGALYRIAGAHTPPEKASVDLVIGAFFNREGDKLVNRRAADEIDKGRQLAEWGRIGGLATQAKAKAYGQAPAKATAQGSAKANQAEALPESQAPPQAEHEATLEAEGVAERQAPHTTTTTTVTATTTNPIAGALRAGLSSHPTWEAYRFAYHERYHIDPVRNARVNTQLANFVKAVGIDEAPHVAAYYLTHNRSTYVTSKHPTSLMLRDAEGLHTEWATNRKIGDTEGRQADRTQATGNAFERLLIEADQAEPQLGDDSP